MVELGWVARKIGLGLRPEDDYSTAPGDWIESQLAGPDARRLCIESVDAAAPAVVEWPAELTYDLKTRIERLLAHRRRRDELDSLGLNPIEDEQLRRENDLAYLHQAKDEHRFANATIYGHDQVKQRLTHFWLNHFTVGAQASEFIGDYWEMVYARLDGSFADLLYRVTSHPAMLTYLDNIYNIGTGSEKARTCTAKDCVVGFNDNLARELLELHTVSPARGYTEDDIHNGARVLAGWGQVFDLPENGSPPDGDWSQPYFTFHAEPGRKTVLGTDIPDGREGLRALTDMLAGDASTRRFISGKLARHFIGEAAGEDDVAAIEQAWAASAGDLPTIHRVVLERAVASPVKHFLSPLPWMFQLLRISGATLLRGHADIGKLTMDGVSRDAGHVMMELGNSFWAMRQPNGYSDRRADWVSSEHLDRRYRLAAMIFEHARPVLSVDEIMERHGFTDATRQLVGQGSTAAHKFILLACSPEMMEV